MSTPRRGTLRTWLVASTVVVGAIVGAMVGSNPGTGLNLTSAWQRRIISPGASGAGQLDGADGIDAADVDGDGLLDVVSGAEQGLRLRLAFHPGLHAVRQEWPSVTIPAVNMCSVEDAVFCDLNDDGALDIMAACETGAQRVEIMFAPTPPNTLAELLQTGNWTRVTIDASANRRSMRIACADIDGDTDMDMVVGGKDDGVNAGDLAWYEQGADPLDGSLWTFNAITGAGWVMQMYLADIDGDTNLDIVYSDKENIVVPTPDATQRGIRILFGDGTGTFGSPVSVTPVEGQWKWFHLVNWDGDAELDIVACRSEPPAVHEQAVYINGGDGASWTEVPIPLVAGVGFCQHTTAYDIDLDTDLDIVTSYSNAEALSGFTWQLRSGDALTPSFTKGQIAGVLDADGDTKFDNLICVDIDEDGDVDCLTTEQHVPNDTGPGLGMLYFENPTIAFVPPPPPPPPDIVDCTLLTQGSQVGGTDAVTASVAPSSNAVVYAFFMSALAANPGTPTVSGNGLTYAQEERITFHNDGDRHITVFRALGASPSAGAITASYGATAQTSHLWAIVECTNVDTGGTNGSGATAQSVTTTVAANTTLTNNLAALNAATSVHLAAVGLSINNSTTPDAQFVELADVSTGTGTSGLEIQWATNETAVTPTWPAAANAGAISLEVIIAP